MTTPQQRLAEFSRNQRCLLVAEVGINHNGDLDLAVRSIEAAAKAGADAVKFQHYRTEDFVFDRALTYTYKSQGREVTETQYDMFKRCELPVEKMREVARACADHGVLYFSTPTGEDGLRELVELGVPFLKNGSDYLQHLPLIQAMARTGIPTILSTGMAAEDEVVAAVDAFREAGGSELILLHCTSSYPTPVDDINLRKIPALRERFGCRSGFSDHSAGIVAALGSVALGAVMIEKHFTLDRGLPGPDHWFSSDPEEWKALSTAVRELERSLGSGVLAPSRSELHARDNYRLSCAAARDLDTGAVLAAADVFFQRPSTGIPPARKGMLLGKRLTAPLRRGELFREDILR